MALKKVFQQPKIDKSEILRYLGIGKSAQNNLDDSLIMLLEESLKEALPVLKYEVSYLRFEGHNIENSPCLKASKLSGAKEAVLFAATIGFDIDRLIKKYEITAPSKAVMLNAIGNERVEALCDVFNAEISEEAEQRGFLTKPRISPGYGDYSLECQKEIIKTLDMNRLLGVTLNESLLMSPTKTVTAAIGIYNEL